MQNLNKTDRQFLYSKYISLGFESLEANKKINDFCDYLRNLQIRLRKKNVDELTINQKFKKEFEKLCQKLEGERCC